MTGGNMASTNPAAKKAPAKKSAAKKAPAKKAAANPVHAAPGMSWGSIEEFLLYVLTLRSNAAYRGDVTILIDYEKQKGNDSNWLANFGMNDRPYQAARSLIGTWNLICTIVEKQFGTNANKDVFMDNTPIANLYAWLRPALQRIAELSERDEKQYAPAFSTLGQAACKRFAANPANAGKFPVPDPMAAGVTVQQAREFYRTADQLTRPLTHFG
jgi:hypothetical protein